MKYQFIVVVLFCGAVLLWFTISTPDNYSYDDLPRSQHSKLKVSSNVINNIQVKLLPSNVPNDTLVNLHNFKYVLNNVSTCATSENEKHFTVIIMVHSARPNFKQRYAIRNTWGSIKTFKEWRLHLIFLLGSDPASPSKINIDLANESKDHGDIIMGNFIDSYHNLTYKHLMGYKWVNTFCPTATFILKTDDDIFVDIFQVVEVLAAGFVSTKNAFACFSMRHQGPFRNATSKWFVPTTLFADDKYPEYCSGSSYLVKTSDAKKIYDVSNTTNFFWIDDVFVSGILRTKYVELSGNNPNSSPLEILDLRKWYHLSNKQDVAKWCRTGFTIGRLPFAFVLLNKKNVVSEMFCIWNKVRMLRFGMNNVSVATPPTPPKRRTVITNHNNGGRA